MAVPPTQAELDMQAATEMYYALRPGAIDEYNKYFLARTPANLQPAMDGLLAPDLPKIMVSDGQIVPLKDEAGVPLPGWKGTARAVDQYSGYIEVSPEP